MSITVESGVTMARVPRLATVADRVRVFRRVLEVLAEPGEIRELAPLFEDREGDGCTLAAAPLLVLADGMSPIASLPGDQAARADVELVSTVTHAPVVEHPTARFVLAHGPFAPERFAEFNRGTAEAPHRAALLVVAVDAVGEGAQRLRLAGPGIDGRRDLTIEGLDAGLWAERAQAIAFPLGVDMVLVDGRGRIAGLPRTTRVEVLS